MRTINRPLIFLLAVSFFMTILPLQSLAVDQPAVSLQKAIETVKHNFQIPPSHTEFTSRFSDYNKRPTWSLNWRATGDVSGYLSVNVDSNTGEITSMNSYQPDDDLSPAVHIPSYTAEEAAKLSESFLKKIAPTHLGELRLIPPLKQSQNANHLMTDYSIHWQRMVGIIPVRGEGAFVRVDKSKGTVVSYQLNWTNTDFPAAARAISVHQAQKAFKDAGMFELQYLVSPEFRPLNQDEPVDPVLVYRLTHKSRGLIDAVSGNPFIIPFGQYLEGLDVYGGSGGAKENMKMPSLDQAATVQLTPEEQEEIRKHSSLLTQQGACEALFKWVTAAKTMSLRSAHLEADYGQPQTRSWSLSFIKSDANGVDFRLYARLDASSGELMSFSYNFPRDAFDSKKTMSREQSEQAARDFLKLIQPEKSRYIRLDADNDNQYTLRDQSPTRYFNYTRLVNNIPIQNQGMSVTVDATTGEIVSYDLNWPDLKFPAPTGIMNSTQAASAYLNQQPLTLSYCTLTAEQGAKDMRLAYMPWNDYESGPYMMLDARTGHLLNWAGQPLTEPPTTETFKDLNGIPAQREINILGQIGFFREYGDSFKPDQPITLVSFLRALILARDGDNRVYDADDAEMMEKAKNRGWLTEKLAPATALSRETAGRILIRYLNLEHVAQLQGIYTNYYKDIEKGSDFVGFAAILKGYKVMEGQSSTFSPTATVSRAEAAQYIFRMSKVNLK